MKKIIYTLSMAFCLMVTFISCKEKDMSMKMNEPRNIKGVVSYKRSFGDLNDTHMAAAKKIGIKPLKDREAAEKLGSKVMEIKNGDFYQVDSLTHSIPFLVPKASALLDSIGANFLDSLENKGLKVTMHGRGTVVQQSIPPGETASPGKLITIMLK